MMKYAWWIPAIDFRVSSGLIFFLLLLLLGRGEKRKGWGWRMAASFAVLLGVSFCIRYFIDQLHFSPFASPIGHSFYIMALGLMYIGCYRFCVRAPTGEYLFNSIVALTVYRMAWNALKSIVVGIQASPVKMPWTVTSPFESLISYVVYCAVCFGCYAIYRRMVKGPCQLRARMLRLLFAVMVVCQMLLEFCFRMMNDGSKIMFLIYLTTFMFCGINFVLLMLLPYLDRLQQDNAGMQSFIRSKQEYYEMSKEGILSLQTKCHDLKHQIRLIRTAEGKRQFDKYLTRLEDSIDEYNTVIETGNKNLDVVLTEKNILCLKGGVKFTYIVDGTLFDFLSEMDTYALFGNIMDNAIESMSDVTSPEKRFISLKAAARGDMVILSVDNYYENELIYHNGLPVTNKKEKFHHGFGLRSILSVAQAYGGTASIHAENNVFKLTVSMKHGGDGYLRQK